jgi:hypothetical protein
VANQFTNPAVLAEGHFVSEHWLRFSEILHDFNPEMELRWIPPEKRDDVTTSKPYAIVHAPENRPHYIVMFASELDDPREILARLFAGDIRRQRNLLDIIDQQNAANEAFRLKQHDEELEVTSDFMHFLMTNRSKWFINTRHPITGEMLHLDHNGRRRR